MGREAKHHYVPRSYLARFTKEGSIGGKLWVFDLNEATKWVSSPANAAHARDYNRLEVDGVDRLVLEKKLFAEIEGRGAAAFDAMERVARKALDAGQWTLRMEAIPFGDIFSFMAVQVARVPRLRESLDDFADQLKVLCAYALTDNEELFKKLKGDSEEFDELTFQEVREYVQSGAYSPETIATSTSHLRATVPSMPAVRDMLSRRAWSVWVAPPAAPVLLVSDDPVLLVEPLRYSGPVGLGTPGATVFFPVSRNVVLHGGQRDVATSCLEVLAMEEHHVRVVNAKMIERAPRYIFSGDADPQ